MTSEGTDSDLSTCVLVALALLALVLTTVAGAVGFGPTTIANATTCTYDAFARARSDVQVLGFGTASSQVVGSRVRSASLGDGGLGTSMTAVSTFVATEAGSAGRARFVVASQGVATDLGPRVSSQRPVVIGEGMTDRVIPAAKSLGADWIQPPAFANEAQSMAWNRNWMNAQMDAGRGVIDIGPAAGRMNFPEPTSPYFSMERGQIMQRNYPWYTQFPWDW